MTFNDRFLKACRKEPTDCTPVWFMRQAGRYQPEYRRLRKKYNLLELVMNPELCVEITLLPVRQLGVDAAILFSDIILPLGPMGIRFQIKENIGPVIESPIRDEKEVERLRPLVPDEELSFVFEAIRLLRQELKVPLIGFAGAPFTLASYLVEGGPSRTFHHTKALMFARSDIWHSLLQKLTDAMVAFLQAQVEAGVQALQIFDTYVGCLSSEDYRGYVLPYMRQLFSRLNVDVPIIHFGVGTSHLLRLMREAGGNVIGLDWRVGLDQAWARLGYDVAVQGNLDPAVLLGPWELIERRTEEILKQAGGRPGHVFNLGHGVLPETSPDVLKRLVEFVHERSVSTG